jgi:tRNA (guanine37-N1)-methyltransferase
MKFSVLTIFPEMINNTLQFGVVGQAIKSGQISFQCINPRTFTKDNHKSVDDRPYGGGDGMVMLCEPIAKCVKATLQAEGSFSKNPGDLVVYLSPQGVPLDYEKVLQFAKYKHIVLICGRYGGIDQRVLNEWVDEEISIGDYVLSGGELAACVLIDTVSRHIDGVLGHSDSSLNDSFSDGLLEAPVFTRPKEWNSQSVPAEFLNGHHENIKKLQRALSFVITFKKRPDLLNKSLDENKIKISELSDSMKTLAKLSEAELESLGLAINDCESFEEWVEKLC